MSTTMPNTVETSVTFSLAELAKIESERVREEDTRRARAREKEARERKEAEARRVAEETAKAAADAEARARRLREEALEKARVEARERAAIDVARIEAEAKARLEADNAVRAHELAMLRVRTEGGQRRLQRALAVVIGLSLCGGGAAAYTTSRHVAALEQTTAELREGQGALAREREDAKATALAALNRRYAALLTRGVIRDAEEARKTAEAARGAVDVKSIDPDRLRAFGDALDVLETRIEGLEKLSALDRRWGDLATWAGSVRKPDAMASARSAASRARATGGEAVALHAYEEALDQVRGSLAKGNAGTSQVTGTGSGTGSGSGTCPKGDPLCDLNGKPVF